MVRPGRITHPDSCIRIGLTNELGGNAKSAATAGSLYGDSAIGERLLKRVTQQQAGNDLIVSGSTSRGHIGFAVLRGNQNFFRSFHRAHHRCPAVGIFVDAHAQIDFRRVGVGAVGS